MKAITAQQLSKTYTLGALRSNSLRETLLGTFRTHKGETLRALDNVSFEVSSGERLGIIGRNGAGKSTLLKVLSRITRPTSGTALIKGRVGSLLEVGTGFHSELSGRENIFLNGAILGMRRSEILSKFDEIVAFSEIEKFIDTPVKHYSSGMYMRLAFSVAAHLDPEILIVDEVLAVGDAAFQKKCLTKMRDIGESGLTVIFVSHDMSAVAKLCDRVLWLKGGRVEMDGDPSEVGAAYLHEQLRTGAVKEYDDPAKAPGDEWAKLVKVRVVDENGNTAPISDIRKKVGIEITYEVLQDDKVIIPNAHFFNEQGTCLFVSHDWSDEWRSTPKPRGVYSSTVWVPGNFLAEGQIFVAAAGSTYLPIEVHFVEWDAVCFTVADSIDGDTSRGDYAGALPGVVRPLLDWTTRSHTGDK